MVDRRANAQSHDYPPEIQEIAERIGENPARFLDVELIETGPRHTSTSGRDLFTARVRGIDRIGVANAWIQVERLLDRGPRDVVIDVLERRRDFLIEQGERPRYSSEELQERRAAREANRDDVEPEPDPVWRHVSCGSTDVTQDSAHSWFCEHCDQQTNRVERVDDADVDDVDDENDFLTNATA